MNPAIHINWYEALMFCKLVGCTLPTEAQWEYACRAGTETPFNMGNVLTTKQANYDGNYPYYKNPEGEYIKSTVPVGSYPPNDWGEGKGLYDMHGNVLEWCMDWYGEDYYDECLKQDVAAVQDPKGPKVGEFRVLRGGSWFDDGQYCRSAHRGLDFPAYPYLLCRISSRVPPVGILLVGRLWHVSKTIWQ